jgi:hypothetical protein
VNVGRSKSQTLLMAPSLMRRCFVATPCISDHVCLVHAGVEMIVTALKSLSVVKDIEWCCWFVKLRSRHERDDKHAFCQNLETFETQALGHRRNRGRTLPCRYSIIYVYKLSVRCKPDLSQKMNSICGRNPGAEYLRTYINET